MKLRSLSPLAVAVGLWVGGLAPAGEPKYLPADSATPSRTTPVSNQQLADAVASKLRQGGHMGAYTINIRCVNGTVELSGRVTDAAHHDAVIQTVLGVPGVSTVVDGLLAANFQPITQTQAPAPGAGNPGQLPPPLNNPAPGGAAPMPAGPIMGGPMGMDPMPINGGGPYDLNPPKMPPYAWPTYAPYNNFSRVAYPEHYPYNAFPFIGPFYPFPKVPLGWRSVTLEWEDGHWYYGRNATKHDYWRVRYW